MVPVVSAPNFERGLAAAFQWRDTACCCFRTVR